MVVLLKFELYWQSYDRLKVGWVLEFDCPQLLDIIDIIYRPPDRFYSWKNDEIARHIKEAQ